MVLVPKALQLTDFDFTIVQCFVNKRHTRGSYAWLKHESFTVFINTRLTPANHNSTFGIIVFQDLS